jgi:hypothetical protein
VKQRHCKKITRPWQALLFAVASGLLGACAAKVKTISPVSQPPVVLTVKSDKLACGALSDQIAGLLGPGNTASNLEPAVISALAMCEQVLLKSKGLQIGNGSLLEALLQSAADPEEVSGYAGLLTRYAQQGGMRRWLYYGPKLAKLFQATYDRRHAARCGRTVREFSYFLQTAPPPLGGDPRRGVAMRKSECEVVSGNERRIPDLDRRDTHLLSAGIARGPGA